MTPELNVSLFGDAHTARTSRCCAEQRAEYLAVLGVKSVLELCVGPSLEELQTAYGRYGISVTGNDIDARWQKHFAAGKWVVGDARSVVSDDFDAVVVAPPLSRGCSGRRADSLSLDEVRPSYCDFLELRSRVVVFVLPGRTLSLKSDRAQLHRFLSRLSGDVQLVPLVDKVVKYVDVCWQPATRS